jgi:uncharacterized protein (TIGR03118 family)
MAASLSGTSVPISPAPIEGQAFTSVVARFSDADNNTDPKLFSAIIDWGNGHVSAGTVVGVASGGFAVIGSYTYPEEGAFRVSAQIIDKDGTVAVVRTTNIVADAALTATGVTIDTTQDRFLTNVVVAKFTDADPAGTATDFVATIAWGDGTSSTGTIVKDIHGGFDVLGSHTFDAPGAFAIQTQIRDGGSGVTSSQSYTPSSLVSDGAVPADHIDPNLLNPWGIVAGGSGPFWVSDNNAGVTTLYDGAGNVIPAVFTIPPPAGQTGTAAPTGVVFNGNDNEFLVNGPGTSAFFIFATEDGTISAWDGGSSAVLKIDNSHNPTAASGAVYKGLTLVTIPTGTLLPAGDYLFAANFRSGKIDVFNSSFKPVTLPAGAFQDPTIPAGYAPFGIRFMDGKLYVTYALQNAAKHDDVEGPGHGFVDVFSVGGFFTQRIGGIGSQPELNSPWGLALAPSNFGKFSNDLLVGNFGDSHVNPDYSHRLMQAARSGCCGA